MIGATEKAGSVGRAVLKNLQTNGADAAIFPVNPKYRRVLGSKCHPAIGRVPGPVDLAVIATPARTVPEIIGQCSAAGVAGAIVLSAGFRECGEEGRRLEEQVDKRRGTMRVIGPNCLGIMIPGAGLNATFAAGMALPGNVAFLSQSGALCTAILDWSVRENVGFSAFVSMGSMLDVGWGDLIDHFVGDPDTQSIVCYMESVGPARAFVSAAREASFLKPLVVIKAGRTAEAARAVVSHTGALAGSDAVLDAAFRRAGVLRVDTIEELFDMAEVLAKQPKPEGPRLMILTNAGGPGILATDMLIAGGGCLAPLSPETRAKLDAVLPAGWSRSNPVDVLGSAKPGLYAKAFQIALDEPGADGVLAVLTPQAMSDPAGTAQKIGALAESRNKPVLASWMGGASMGAARAKLNKARIPTYDYPDEAVRAFARMWQYSDAQRLLYERPSLPASADAAADKRNKAGALLKTAARKGRTLLTEAESKQVLAGYGIPVVETRAARSAEEAVSLAGKIGFPVVLKLLSSTVAHKTDAGGVHLNLGTAAAVRRAWNAIQRSAGGEAFEGVTVQPFVVKPGIELILGGTLDPQFGHVLLFGAGGEFVEVFRDRVIDLPPLTVTLARRMIERTRIHRALLGVRGRPPVDLDALAGVLVRFSHLITEQRERIAEMEINPLLTSADGFLALDARIVLHKPGTEATEIPPLAFRPYPAEYAAVVRLAGGTRVTLRPIRPEDEAMLEAFHGTLSESTVAARYFAALPLRARIRHERLSRICFADYDREIAMVAERKRGRTGRELIAVGRINRLHGENAAEFAVLVADAWQRKGLGTRLLRQLLHVARAEKLERVVGVVQSGNKGMLRVCRREGFRMRKSSDGAEFNVEIML